MLTFLDAKGSAGLDPLGVYSAHRLDDGRWEVLALDDDTRRPPWIRVAIVTVPGEALAPSKTHSGLSRDSRRRVSVRLRDRPRRW